MIYIPFTRQGGIDPRYVQALFAGIHEKYDIVLVAMTLGMDYMWKRVMKRYIPSMSRRVLDLGTGTGVFSYMLDHKCEIVGIDISREMLRIATRKKSRTNGSIDFVQASAEHLPFRYAAFDAIGSCYVMKYCDRKLMLNEVFRVSSSACIVAVYDFSMPRIFSPAWFYLFAFMSLLSVVMKKFWKGFATVLSDLPTIIGRVRWENDLLVRLSEKGVSFSHLIRMTNEVVTLVIWKISKN